MAHVRATRPNRHSDVDLVIVDPPLVSEKTLFAVEAGIRGIKFFPLGLIFLFGANFLIHFRRSSKIKHEIFYLPPKT